MLTVMKEWKTEQKNSARSMCVYSEAWISEEHMCLSAFGLAKNKKKRDKQFEYLVNMKADCVNQGFHFVNYLQ